MGFFTCVPQWKGEYTKCHDIATLEVADQIAIWDYGKYFRYQHHGLIWRVGTTIDEIQVCHIWSPYENRVESQADSHFRISSLRDFLYKRPLSALRIVEYNTSSARTWLNDAGEVHMYPSDCPEIVLARCRFLMGLGKGEFDIFTQNCEHAAHWCKTGIQYCAQGMTMAAGSIPFQKEMSINQEQALHAQIATIKECIQLEMNRVVQLCEHGQLVYLKVKSSEDDQYLKVVDNQVTLTTKGEQGTPFRIHQNCTKPQRYDRIHIRIENPETNESLYSHIHWRGDRNVQIKDKKKHSSRAVTWEYRSTGHVVSQRQHRRYWSIKDKSNKSSNKRKSNKSKNNPLQQQVLLEETSLRGKATKFVFVKVADDDDTTTSVIIVPDLPDLGDPTTQHHHPAEQPQPAAAAAQLPKIHEQEEEEDTSTSAAAAGDVVVPIELPVVVQSKIQPLQQQEESRKTATTILVGDF